MVIVILMVVLICSHVGIQMYDDVMRSQADKFPRLLANMRVLLYQVSSKYLNAVLGT